jgi:hypothetical protein
MLRYGDQKTFFVEVEARLDKVNMTAGGADP